MFVEFFHYLFTERGIENEYGTILERFIQHQLHIRKATNCYEFDNFEEFDAYFRNPNLSIQFLDKVMPDLILGEIWQAFRHPYITVDFIKRHKRKLFNYEREMAYERDIRDLERMILLDLHFDRGEILLELAKLFFPKTFNKKIEIIKNTGSRAGTFENNPKKIFYRLKWDTNKFGKKTASQLEILAKKREKEPNIFNLGLPVFDSLHTEYFLYNEENAKRIFLSNSEPKLKYDKKTNRIRGGIDIFQGLPRFDKSELKRRVTEIKNRRKYAPGEIGYKKAEKNFNSLL